MDVDANVVFCVCLCISSRTVKRKSFNEDDSLTLYWLFRTYNASVLCAEVFTIEVARESVKRQNKIIVTLDFVQLNEENFHFISGEVRMAHD